MKGRDLVVMELKRTHFKMYKVGRKWVFACAVVLAMGSGATLTASADVSSSSSSQSTQSSRVASDQNSERSGGTAVSGANRVSESNQQSSEETSQVSGSQAENSHSASSSSSQSQSTDSASDSESSSSRSTTPVSEAVTTESETVTTNTPAAKPSAVKHATTSAKKSPVVKSFKHSSRINSALTAAKQAATTTQLRAKVNALIEKAQAAMPAQTTALTPLAEAEIQAGGSVYDDYPDLDNLLGVSSVFHIFAREAELNAHTNGNVAVQNLIGNVNFGTSIIEELLDKDISYIQNITNIAGSSFVSKGDTRENKVVFGDGISIDISNPNRPMVNGVYIDHLLADEVYQDQNGQTYIDFDAEFAKLKTLNATLAGKPSVANYTNSDFADQNNRVIDISDMTPNANNQIVINLTPDVLQGNTPLTIKGLSPDAEGTTVIVNVDTGGQADYDVRSQIKLIYSDGSDRNNQETEHFGDNHLLWNFYDSTASDKQFGGTIHVNAPFQGSILAPSATIEANQNIDGNLIADKVIVNAETHRWDLQGNEDEDIEEEEFEKPVHPGIDVELPNIEEPEEPGTEEPGTEEPGTEEPGIEEPGEGGDEDLGYEHERPDYDEDEVTEDLWDDLIDDESEDPTTAHADEEALLNRVDQAIAQAKAQGNTALVAKLQAIRSRILADLGGLPQTGEAQNNWAPAVGAALLASLLGTLGAIKIKKHRN